jgi:hypothetical protein
MFVTDVLELHCRSTIVRCASSDLLAALIGRYRRQRDPGYPNPDFNLLGTNYSDTQECPRLARAGQCRATMDSELLCSNEPSPWLREEL